MKSLILIAALSIAGSMITRFGLYDYQDKFWHAALLWSPVLCVLALLVERRRVKRIWAAPRGHWLALALPAALFIAALGGVTWYIGAGRDVTLKVCNGAPYELALAVNYRPHRLARLTEGYWGVPAGECRAVTRKFLRSTPKFYVFVANKEDLGHWFENSEPRWDFDKYETLTWAYGGAAATRSPATHGLVQAQEVPWESAKTLCIGPRLALDKSWDTAGPAGECPNPRAGGYQAPFLEVPHASESGDEHQLWFGRGGRDVALEVCNILPYNSALAFHYQSKKAEWKTEPAVPVAPGQCRTFERNFQRVEPNLYVHQVIGGSVEKWHLNSYNAGNEWRTTGKERGEDGGVLQSVTACVGGPGRAVNDIEQAQECRPGETLRAFVRVEYQADGEAPAKRYLHAEALPFPRKGDGSVDHERAVSEAAALSQALFQRMLHRISWPKDSAKPVPYLIGFAPVPEDFYGEHFRGVTVAQAAEMTPFGARVPVVAGEEIVRLNDRPVFSVEDIRRALIVFAELKDKGIMKPYSVTVMREGREITRWGWFFFNAAAFKHSEYDRRAAYEWGNSAGWSLFGDPVKRRCAKDTDPDCVWRETQEFWRLKQLYVSDYEKGQFWGTALQGVASVVVLGPIARIIRWLLGLGASRAAILASQVLVGSTLAAAELSTLAAIESPPGGNVHKEVRDAARLGAKIGAASVLLSPLKALPRGARR